MLRLQRRNLQDRTEQNNGQKKGDRKTNNDPQRIQRRLKIEQHESHKNPLVNSGAPEG